MVFWNHNHTFDDWHNSSTQSLHSNFGLYTTRPLYHQVLNYLSNISRCRRHYICPIFNNAKILNFSFSGSPHADCMPPVLLRSSVLDTWNNVCAVSHLTNRLRHQSPKALNGPHTKCLFVCRIIHASQLCASSLLDKESATPLASSSDRMKINSCRAFPTWILYQAVSTRASFAIRTNN